MPPSDPIQKVFDRPAAGPDFDRIGMVANLGVIWHCEGCGALVRECDRELHGRFHGAMVDTSRILGAVVGSTDLHSVAGG